MKILKLVLFIIISVLISSCERGCGTCCVEPDDWGYPKINVSAVGSKLDIEGSYSNQIARPYNSGQVLINAYKSNLLISVAPNDKWSAWSGGSEEYSYKNDDGKGSSWSAEIYIPDNRECFYADTNPSTYDPAPKVIKYIGMLDTKDSNLVEFMQSFCSKGTTNKEQRPSLLKFWPDHPPEFPITEEMILEDEKGSEISFGPYNYNPDQYADCVVPCWLKYGMGLYVGLAPHNGSESEINLTYHIPDAKNPWVPYNHQKTPEENLKAQKRDGFLTNGFAAEEWPGSETYDRLYFKIVDNYYGDNIGGYTVRLKEGTRSPDPGPLEGLVNVVEEPVLVVMERIFRAMVQNNDYIVLVRIFLVLFVVCYAFLFMMGAIQKPKEDLTINMLRIAVVIQLLSPDVYDFFYNYFFVAFLKGSMEIASLFIQGGYAYDPASPWFSVDQMLHRFISSETIQKCLALIFSNVWGVVFVVVYFIGVGFLIIATFKALMLYLVGLVSMAVLVIIAPVIIVALLYSRTRDLFDEWVNHFLAFAVQIIVAFAALGMFIMIVIMFQEKNLGFPVCWKTWLSLDFLGIHIVDLKFFLPEITDMRGDLYMDWDYNGAREWYSDYNPVAYSKGIIPYIDLPYLDPYKDKDQILTMLGGTNFVNLSEITLFFAAIILMETFMVFVQKIANVLKGGAGTKDIASLFPGSDVLWNSFKRISVGDNKSGKSLKGSNALSKRFYKSTGRSGGLLGGIARGGASLGKKYRLDKAGKFTAKKTKSYGGKGLGYGGKGLSKLSGGVSSGKDSVKKSWNRRGVPKYEGPHLASNSPISSSLNESSSIEKTKKIGGTKELIKTDYNFRSELEKQLSQSKKDKLSRAGGYKKAYARSLTNISSSDRSKASYLNKYSKKENLSKEDYKKVLNKQSRRSLTPEDFQLINKSNLNQGQIKKFSDDLQNPNLKDRDREKLLKEARNTVIKEITQSAGDVRFRGSKFFSGEQNYRAGYLTDKEKFLDAKEKYINELKDKFSSEDEKDIKALRGAGLDEDFIEKELKQIKEDKDKILSTYSDILSENEHAIQSNEKALEELEKDREVFIRQIKEFDDLKYTLDVSSEKYEVPKDDESLSEDSESTLEGRDLDKEAEELNAQKEEEAEELSQSGDLNFTHLIEEDSVLSQEGLHRHNEESKQKEAARQKESEQKKKDKEKAKKELTQKLVELRTKVDDLERAKEASKDNAPKVAEYNSQISKLRTEINNIQSQLKSTN